MPTNHDETLHERYAREHQVELGIYARMTPEQISEMATELHNALARLAALESQQAASVGGEREAFSDAEIKAAYQRALGQTLREQDFATVRLFANELRRPADDDLWEQTLEERDCYHGAADGLVKAISDHFGADFGEHSSLNDPWANAIEFLGEQARAALSPAGGGVAHDVATLQFALSELHKSGIKPGSLPHMVLTNLIDDTKPQANSQEGSK